MAGRHLVTETMGQNAENFQLSEDIFNLDTNRRKETIGIDLFSD